MRTQAKICCTSGGPENVPKCFFTLLLNSTLSHFVGSSSHYKKSNLYIFFTPTWDISLSLKKIPN